MARRQEALSFPPGEKFSYSNTGYNLLARTVETITEQDFSSWIQENILDPLEMNHSHFHDDLGRVITNRVRSYQGNKNGPFRNVGNQLMALGSSSLYSTVNDLLKWIRHFDHPTITSPGVIALNNGNSAGKSMQLAPGSLNNGNSAGYAYGFGVGEYRGTKRISHSGGWAGFRTYLLYLPEFKLGVVVLSNWSGMNTSSTLPSK
jgi:CubicO group peptidase (beta-lactamase class C family)